MPCAIDIEKEVIFRYFLLHRYSDDHGYIKANSKFCSASLIQLASLESCFAVQCNRREIVSFQDIDSNCL